MLNQDGIAFSTNGLKMYVGGDTTKLVIEYDLVCPFNIIAGKCPPVTENSVRTGIAECTNRRSLTRTIDTLN